MINRGVNILYIIYIITSILVFMFLAICAAFIYSLPPYLKLRNRGVTSIRDNVVTIEDAVVYLRSKKLKEWVLVKESQKIVAEKMEYSRRNNWDTAEKAFARGMGYCLQQADALKIILLEFGIDVRLVQCMKNTFPPKKIHEYYSEGGTCGHVWLRVRINGEEKDVCAGNINNEPGVVHFKINGKVTNYSGIIKILGHIGSAYMNTVWDKKDKKKV